MTSSPEILPDLAADFSLLPPLSLYVHIPWCLKKCPYCDFNSHAVTTDSIDERAYLTALVEDLKADLPLCQGRPLRSVFIGGGTPSLFHADIIAELIDAIHRLVGLEPDAEITLEANPGTFEQQRFEGFRRAGVNRLSIGVQSFQNSKLSALGRVHNSQEAHTAVHCARDMDFLSLNIDLMFGLPTQSVSEALVDLDTAMALRPDHLSWYQLTLEPHTEFHRHPPELPQEDPLAEMQLAGQQRLREGGYSQYEVSAYARPGHECRHNRNYWEFGDYLGIGAGAHGKISQLQGGGVYRRRKIRHPRPYQAAPISRVAEHQRIARDQLPMEFLMNSLRLNKGVSIALFEERTGLTVDQLEPALGNARERGLMQNSPDDLRPTALGHRYLNNLLELFL